MRVAARVKVREDPSVQAGAGSIAARLQSNCRSLRPGSNPHNSRRLRLCHSRLPGRNQIQIRILKMKRRRSLHRNLSGTPLRENRLDAVRA